MRSRWVFALLLAAYSIAAAAQALQLGEVEFPTSARSKEAQEHFARGVAALHSFWYPVALEQFRAAARIEPQFAMAYWGEAMTHNHPVWGDPQDGSAGRAAIKKIQPGWLVTPRERAYIDAVKLLYGEGDKPARDKAYGQAMRKLHERHPQDAEAALFYALALMGTGDEDSSLRAGEIALHVFKDKPKHPGAAHYAIHAYDDPKHAHLALPAAQRYAEIAPDSSHALHMPSHIFLQLGMWPEAAESNERAWSAGKSDIHALHWLGYVYLQQGRYREAQELLGTMRDALAQQSRDDQHRLMYAAYTRASVAATYLIETQQWQRADEVLGKPTEARDEKAQAFLAIAESPATFARGLAAAHAGQPAEAAKAAAILTDLKAPPGAEKVSYIADILAAARIQARLIGAAAAAERKDFGKALQDARDAIAAADRTVTPPGPPVLIKPPHELVAEILLQAGKAEEAAKGFETVLARHKDRARALLGAARTAAAGGHAEQAAAIYAKLNRQWQGADAGIAELREAREQRTGDAAAGSSRRE